MFGNEKMNKPVVVGVTIFIISFWILILGGCFRNMIVFWIGFGVIMAESIGAIIGVTIRQVNKLDWKCNKCGTTFSITWKQSITGINGGSVKELYCPHCEKKTWCDPVRMKSDKNNKEINNKEINNKDTNRKG